MKIIRKEQDSHPDQIRVWVEKNDGNAIMFSVPRGTTNLEILQKAQEINQEEIRFIRRQRIEREEYIEDMTQEEKEEALERVNQKIRRLLEIRNLLQN